MAENIVASLSSLESQARESGARALTIWLYCDGERQSENIKNLLKTGENALKEGRFDDARKAFGEAAADGDCAGAYFGMALAKFGVCYATSYDEDGGTSFTPFCGTFVGSAFCDCEEFEKAMTLLGESDVGYIREMGEEIDRVRAKCAEFSARGMEFDTYICADGQADEARKMADEMCDRLRWQGIKPFFEQKQLAEADEEERKYLPIYALSRAKCMIVVCLDKGELDSENMKNAYLRYAELIEYGRKRENSIALAYGDEEISLPDIKAESWSVTRDGLDRAESFANAFMPPKPIDPKMAKAMLAAEKRERARRNAKRFFTAVGGGIKDFFVWLGEALGNMFRAIGRGAPGFFANLGKMLAAPFVGAWKLIRSGGVPPMIFHIVMCALEMTIILFEIAYPYSGKFVEPSAGYTAHIVMGWILFAFAMVQGAFTVINGFVNGVHGQTKRILIILAIETGITILCVVIGGVTDNTHDWIWICFALDLAAGVIYIIVRAMRYDNGFDEVLATIGFTMVWFVLACGSIGEWARGEAPKKAEEEQTEPAPAVYTYEGDIRTIEIADGNGGSAAYLRFSDDGGCRFESAM